MVARIAEFFGAPLRDSAARGTDAGLKAPHVLRRFIGKADDVRC